MRTVGILVLGLLLTITSAVSQQTENALPSPAPTASAPAAPAASPEPAAMPAATPEPAAAPAEPVAAVKPAIVNTVLLDFVKSSRKWQLGFRHEPYDKISTFTVEHLSKALEAKELKSASELSEGCCKLSLELLQVSTRQAIIKDPGIDVAANLTVTDAKGKLIFSKGYQGRSGTYFMNTWGHLINNACENMVENMAKDEMLIKVLQAGKLPD